MSTKGSKKSRNGIEQAIAQLVSKGKNPNFLFIGDSVLHVASFNAFISYMQDNGIEMCGVVCNGIPSNRISQFDADSITSINAGDFAYLKNGEDIDLREFPLDTITDAVQLLSTLRSCNQNESSWEESNKDNDSSPYFYLIFPGTDSPKRMVWNAVFAYDRHVCRVIIDEGIGTYVQTPETWHKLSLAKTKSPIARIAKRFRWNVMRPVQKAQRELMESCVVEERFCLFDQGDNGSLRVNQRCRKYLDKAFNDAAVRQDASQHDYDNTAILVTTIAFVEAGCPELEIDFYRPVVNALRQCGYRVVLRPHPRDKDPQRYRCLGVDLDCDDRVPFESLISLSTSKPALTIGLFSTVQVTANALWGIPAVVLSGWFSEYVDKAGSERITHFVSSTTRASAVFSSFVEDVSCEEDFLALLHVLRNGDASASRRSNG